MRNCLELLQETLKLMFKIHEREIDEKKNIYILLMQKYIYVQLDVVKGNQKTIIDI